jgi:type III secretion protein V
MMPHWRLMSPWTRKLAPLGSPDLVMASVIVLIVGMLLLPLPTWALDLLIATNIGASLLLLTTALYLREGLDLSAFPTLLLVTTLFRLGLNVSSTRLILLDADAGDIIHAFGDFVVRGDFAVGAVVFAILMLVQLVVVSKGAERVAEVGARFTLDAMPGKQMSIDAELRSGLLDRDGARAKRSRLERESQFYGAMDGAMKFVKGDAIAGVVITLINVAAGTSIGTFSRGLSLRESLETYALLTIGDGLVSQIPALLVSTSAGLVVTRVASRDGRSSLGSEVSFQLLRDHRSLATASVFLCALAIVPGLPFFPFAALACLSGAVLLRGIRRDAAMAANDREDARSAPKKPGRAPAFAPRLCVRIGATIESWLPEAERAVVAREALADAARRAILERHGFELDELEVHVDETLHSCDVLVAVRGVAAKRARLDRPDRVTADCVALASAAAAENVAEIFGLEECQRLCDALERTRPALVRNVVPKPVPLALLTDVTRRLAEEGLSLAHLPSILDALAIHAPNERDPLELTELCRAELGHPLVSPFVTEGALEVHLVDPEIEEAVRESIRRTAAGSFLAMPPDDATAVVERVRASGARVVLTQSDVRRFVRKLIQPDLPDVAVLSYAELPARLRVEPRGTITIESSRDAAA